MIFSTEVVFPPSFSITVGKLLLDKVMATHTSSGLLLELTLANPVLLLRIMSLKDDKGSVVNPVTLVFPDL